MLDIGYLWARAIVKYLRQIESRVTEVSGLDPVPRESGNEKLSPFASAVENAEARTCTH